MSRPIGLAAAFAALGVDLPLAGDDAIRCAIRLSLQPAMEIQGHAACQVVGLLISPSFKGVKHHRVWDGDMLFTPSVILEDARDQLMGHGLDGLATDGGLAIGQDNPYSRTIVDRRRRAS